MDKLIKKKLKIVLIAFCILIIPIGYLIAISIAIEMHDEALQLAVIRYPDDKEVAKQSIEKIEKAIKIYPWNYLFWMNKAQLQIKLKDYQGALVSAKKGIELKNQYLEGLEYQGIIYEYLNQPDSAKIYYLKAIEKHKERLENNEGNSIITSKQIALLYTFVGDSINATRYFVDTSNESDYSSKTTYDRFDFYMENYQTGGLKDFLYGVSIEMVNDSISDESIIDSLLADLRIYYESHSSTIIDNRRQKSVYNFKKIFMDKAKTIGFKETNK